LFCLVSADGRITESESAAIDLPPGEADEIEVYARELAAATAEEAEREAQGAEPAGRGEERRRTALLLYDMGRRWRQRQNLPNAAQCFLRAYTLAPELRAVVREARRIYQDRGDHRLVVKLLDAEARASRPGAERAALYREKGRILEEHQADRAGAEAAYRAALVEDPQDLAALSALDRLLESVGNAAAVRETLGRMVHASADPQLRAVLLRELGQLEFERGDVHGAQAALSRALELVPAHPVVLADLEHLYEARGAFAELTQTLEQRLPAAPNPAATAAIELRIARLLRDRVGEPVQAADWMRRALERTPEDSLAAAEYQRLCEDLSRHDEVAWALALRAAKCDDPALGASIYHQLGLVRHHHLRDDAGAVEALLESAARAPGYVPTLAALGRLLSARGDFATLADIHLAELPALADPRQRAARLYKAGEIHERHLAAPDCDPTDPALAQAILLYSRAVEEVAGYLPAVNALERLYTRTGRFADLCTLYDREARRAPALTRAQLWEAMGRLWADRLADPDRAIECYRKVLDDDATNLVAIRELARLYARTWHWRELVDMGEREIALIGDPRRTVQLLQRLGEIWEDRLLDLERAAGCYQRALAIAPAFLPALKALGRIYRQKGRWEDLIAMHRAEVALTDSPEQITFLLYAIAEIYDDELFRPAEAARTYREILERVPGYLPALTSLEALYEERRDFQELAALREAQLEATGDDRSKALLLAQTGSLREERLDQPEVAAQDLARALRLLPDLQPAQAQLAHIYEVEGEHAKLADLYARILEQAPPGRERALVGERLGELWDRHLGGPRKAATYYEAALESEPTTHATTSLHALGGIYRRLGLLRELALTYERQAERLSDPAVAAGYHFRAGQIREDHQSALGEPAPAYRRALELAPSHAGARRALERVLRDQQGPPRELANLLGDRLSGCRDASERAALRVEIAEVLEANGEREAAEATLRQALADDPQNLPALWGLERIAAESGQAAARVELLLAQVAILADPQSRVQALLAAAQAYDEQLGEPASAAPLYRQVLELEPAHDQAFERLRLHLLRKSAWTELCDLLRHRVGAIPDRAEIARRLGEMADIYIVHLDQSRKGMSCLRKAIEIDPYDPKALSDLARLYDQGQQWAKALTMYGRAAAVIDDPAVRRSMELRTAELWEALGDLPQALGTYRRLLLRLPDDEVALERASDLAEEVGDFPLAAQVLERRAELVGDPERRITLRKRLATICEERLDEPERAARALKATLELNPLDAQSVERLAALYGRLGDREALDAHLERSIGTFRHALQATPLEVERLRELARIYHWQKHYAGLLGTFATLAFLGQADAGTRAYLGEALSRRQAAFDPARAARAVEKPFAALPERAPLRELLRVVGEGLLAIETKDLHRRGLVTGERLREDMLQVGQIAQLAPLAGLARVEVWLAKTESRACHVLPTPVPALVLGSELLQSFPSSGRVRFRVARALLLYREQLLGPIGELTARELAQLVAAGLSEGLGSEPPSLGESERATIQAEARRLHKGLSRKSREALRAAAEGFVAQVRAFDAAAYLLRTDELATAAATALVGDPEAALVETAAGTQLRSPQVLALARFILSDEHAALRRELGWA
jgi:tetratricopeptide (TPR) repeat protein